MSIPPFTIAFTNDGESSYFVHMFRRIREFSDTVCLRIRNGALCVHVTSPEYFYACEFSMRSKSISCEQDTSVNINVDTLSELLDKTHQIKRVYPVIYSSDHAIHYSDTVNSIDSLVDVNMSDNRTFFSISPSQLSSLDQFCFGINAVTLRSLLNADAVASGAISSTGGHEDSTIMKLTVSPCEDDWIEIKTVTTGRNAMKLERLIRCHRRSSRMPVFERCEHVIEIGVLTTALFQFVQRLTEADMLKFRVTSEGLMVTTCTTIDDSTGNYSRIYITNMHDIDTHSYV